MRYGLFWLVFIISLSSRAQLPYGNEWIRPDHHYLRLGITHTGWYRVGHADLKRQGVDPAGIAAKSLKLFRRGQEIAIEVSGEQDGQLDASDYVEFYGHRNDGWLDTLLYVAPQAMPHPYYSLYSDTATYFLAWQAVGQETTGTDGKRIEKITSQTTEPKAIYHNEEVRQIFTSDYPAGNIYPFGAGYDDGYISTEYDYGEGWTGPIRPAGQWEVIRLQTEAPVREEFSWARLEVLFVGRNSGPHQVEVWTGDAIKQGRKLGQISWKDYNTAKFTATFRPEDLSESGLISIAFVAKQPGGLVSSSYVCWQYPQKISVESISTQKLIQPAMNQPIEAGSQKEVRFFDVTTNNIRQLMPDSAGLIAAQHGQLIAVVRQPLPVTNWRRVQFKTIDPSLTDYLIVSHPLVRKPVAGSDDPVADYAAYRASATGGAFVPLLLNADEVADQFNYGEPGPNGTRRLMRWLHDRGRLRYTFLIGRSRSPQIVRTQPDARNEDMVPSAGWPDSDIALGMGLDPAHPTVPLVPIGRLNASDSRNVWDYLQKVKQHEAAPPAQPWRKNILHLSGGRSYGELATFRSFMDDYAARIDSSVVAPRLYTLSKKTDEPVERFDLSPQLNEGVALLTMFGHSSLSVTDIDIGFASNDALGYRNKGRYPAVLTNGCALGNFYFGPTPISTDWILAPDRGAILFLAHTHNGLTAEMYAYSWQLYETLADPTFTSLGFGDIMREGIRRYMLTKSTRSAQVTAQQMNLQGDPAIRIFPATRPDYTWEPATLQITNAGGGKVTAWDDTLRVRAEVANNGRYLNNPYSVRILRRRGTETITDTTISRMAILLRDTLQFLLPNMSRQGGDETWELLLDPQNGIAEENETNNRLTLPVRVEEGGAIALLPADGALYTTPQAELIAQVPASRASAPVVFEWASNATFGPDTRRDTVLADKTLARHPLTLIPPPPQTVYWRVRIAGDPAPTHRFFRYGEPTIDFPPAHPEGVASLVSFSAQTLAEGAPVRARVSFENISPVSFSDSIQVLVREMRAGAVTEKKFYIAPLAGKTTFQYDYVATTLNKSGNNRTLIYFNSGRLPEQLYLNNAVEWAYEVVPDQTPPVLDVLVDGQRLSDQEAVRPQPRLQVRIFDSNSYLLRTDTTGLRISLKQDCGACPSSSVSLDKAIWQTMPVKDFLLEVDLPFLAPGTYLLTVQARDLKGNKAAPYAIRFRIADQNRIVKAMATPNPAALWVKFGLELEGQSVPDTWRVLIFDTAGKKIFTLKKKPTLGNNEIFWVPEGVASGLYIYKMDLEGTGWPAANLPTGKILISR